MSPVSRSKPKDKKGGKEPPKPSAKINTSNGIPSSGYNPLLGTFHTIDSPPPPSAAPLHVNGRFRNIDDTDDQTANTFTEYDSVSNNGSWSGESEDHKEKPSHPTSKQESVPGADNDKREKIRQKNERKHQRQKERRAQELHERCSGYLMSRKLELLAQQLVSMGFSQERATMALILNEGRVEESVAWLFEGGEEDKRAEQNVETGGNLKIDISEELARISEMEARYKASKQEVERAIVAFEGDLEKAEEMLKAQKQEPPTISPTPEETGDPPTNGKLPAGVSHNSVRLQTKIAPPFIQQKRDEKDFNYNNKGGATVLPQIQTMKKAPPKMEWAKPQQIPLPSDKRWPDSIPNRSVSSSSPPTARYLAVGNELKNLQLGSVREPITMMQRPQSINSKPAPLETAKPNGFVSPNRVGSNLFYNPQQINSNYSRGNASPTLSAASSLGLFSGLGAGAPSGSSSPVDWSTGSSMLQLDYTNIDWSLDLGSSSSSSSSNSNYSNGWKYDSFGYNVGAVNSKPAIRPVVSSSVGGAAVQEEGKTSEWSSPFEEKDLFSVPRQFVSSPSL